MKWIALNFRPLPLVLSLALAACSSDDSSKNLDSAVHPDAVADTGHVDQAGADQAPGPDLAADASSDSAEEVDSTLVDQGGADSSADGGGCAEHFGSGSLSGTVSGNALSASYAAGMEVDLGATGYDVSFFAAPKTCAGYTSMSLSVLWLMTCDNAPGTYTIGDSCSGALSVVNQLGIPAGSAELKADSGTITITAFDKACGGSVKGSFDVSIGSDQVTGTFDTISCGLDAP